MKVVKLRDEAMDIFRSGGRWGNKSYSIGFGGVFPNCKGVLDMKHRKNCKAALTGLVVGAISRAL